MYLDLDPEIPILFFSYLNMNIVALARILKLITNSQK